MEKDAVVVSNVSKTFTLPHEKVASVKDLFIKPLASLKGSRKEAQRALVGIDFSVNKGEFFGIVGRNGSGKSTLLKIIAGIYQPTKGSVSVNGRLVPFIELGVGFNPELTGRENVYLNGALMGFNTKEVKARYRDIVEFSELDNFMDQKLKNYSSGMQVRLAFSVATVLADSDILLIDEVLAVGDAAFQRKCFSYFRKLKKLKKTVIFVSHDMEAIREYCDRCALIDRSEVLYVGSPEVAAEKYLKQFNQETAAQEPAEQAKNDERWGDGAARVKSVDVTVEKEVVRIHSTLHFVNDLEDPIVGFIIKNSSGQALCGTNNKIIRTKLGNFTAGKDIILEWDVPNIFGDDTFTVESAVTHRDGVTQADWWHNAAQFTIRNDQSTPHNVSPRIKLKVIN